MRHQIMILFLISQIMHSCYYQNNCNCEVDAWLRNNIEFVRDKPYGKIIDTLYARNIKDVGLIENIAHQDDMNEMIYVRVIESKDEWVEIFPLIEKDVPYKVISTKKVEFFPDTTRLYWIKGEQIEVLALNRDGDTTGIALYKRPDKASKTIGKLQSSHLSCCQIVQILGCCKGWAYVVGINDKGKIIKGWLPPDNQCTDPFEACDDNQNYLH